ncbi:hypothetical protein AcV5_009948 [Taiwanofungus camphoratus]|nr:hypothetical protein AcV5_009948 [Antrodia cinnamomea]
MEYFSTWERLEVSCHRVQGARLNSPRMTSTKTFLSSSTLLTSCSGSYFSMFYRDKAGCPMGVLCDWDLAMFRPTSEQYQQDDQGDEEDNANEIPANSSDRDQTSLQVQATDPSPQGKKAETVAKADATPKDPLNGQNMARGQVHSWLWTCYQSKRSFTATVTILNPSFSFSLGSVPYLIPRGIASDIFLNGK